MPDQAKSYRDTVNRRRFLELMGISGVAALAGCSGDSGDGGGDGEKTMDGEHITYTSLVPSDLQWNPDNASAYGSISAQILFDQFASYSFAKGELEPYAISEWSFDGMSLELTLRDGLTWANGDDVTSADIATQLRIGLYTAAAYESYTKSIETPDKKTVVMNFDKKVNERIIEFDVLPGNFVQQKKSVFGKYLDKLKKDEKKGSRALAKFAWKEPITSGPFEFEEASQQQLLLKRRDDHPDSGNIDFGKYIFRYIKGNTGVHQALKNQEIDSAPTVFTPPKVADTFPDAIKQIQIPAAWGYGLVPNHDDKHLGDRAVRQAIQYVIDRKQVVKNVSADSKKSPKFPVGITSGTQEKWLGKAADDFNTYGVDSSQTKKAAKALKRAGYSKEDSTWKDSDGKAVRLPIMVPSSWSDWVTATQTIVDQLSSFGFDAVVSGRKPTVLTGNIWPKGKFKITAGSWLAGAPDGTYPYFSLRHQLVKSVGGFKYNYPAAVPKRGGSRKDITVPSRTGSGKMTTNPSDRLNELSSTSTDKKSKINDIIVEQAWVTNQDLPILAVMEKVEQTFITDGDEWNVPKPDADVAQVRWANMWLPRKGKMQYTG